MHYSFLYPFNRVLGIAPRRFTPDTAAHAPNTAAHAPDTAAHAPDTAAHAPDTAAHAPDTAAHAPYTAANAPDTAAHAPNAAAHAPYMNSRQSRKLAMYLSVRDYLSDTETTWSVLPAFVASVGRFRVSLTEIDATTQEREKTSAGATAEKQRRQQIMADQAVMVGSLIRAAALVTGDVELESDSSIAQSDVTRARDSAAADRPKTVLRLGRARVDSLADYGVTTGMLDNLASAIENWEQIVSRPRTIISGGSVLTAELALLFDQTDDVLEILDRLSLFFKPNQPGFVAGWEAARVIVDSGGGGSLSPTDEPVG